jgi:CubicO group peptidase (beta-lactamase class C family)
MTVRWILPFALVSLAVALPSAAQTPAITTEAADPLATLDADVAAMLAAWRVPGVAVAVVRADRVVVAKGYGVRKVGSPEPVNADTQFVIASVSKAFAAMGVALLVDDGKVDWDAPVQRYLPEFQLADPAASQSVSPRDLLSHRTGLPRHDLVWYGRGAMAWPEMLSRLPHLPLTAPPRARYQYNNLMFATTGALVERVSGQRWADFVQSRIFNPLNMTRSNVTVQLMARDGNAAAGHLLDRRTDAVRSIALRDVDVLGPAGAINTTVVDLAQWMRVQLNNGQLGDKRFVSPQQLAQMHRATMTEGLPAGSDSGDAAYGLGWRIDSYRGLRRVSHGGNLDGFTARLTLFPSRGIGIVVLANMEGSGLPEALARTLSDRLLGLAARDWSAPGLRNRSEDTVLRREAEARKPLTRIAKTKPSLPLAAYAGTYRHPGYGDVTVRLDGKALVAQAGDIRIPLLHWHYDVFLPQVPQEEDAWEDAKFAFRLDYDGRVEGIDIATEPRVAPQRFARLPDARATDPRYLDTLVGDYAYGAERTWRLRRVGSRLILDIAGQEPQSLTPAQDGGFFLVNNVTTRLEPWLDPKSGNVIGLRVHQPEGPYLLPRKS